MPSPQEVQKKTASCQKVWDLINKVIELDKGLGDELADVFCTFECGWTEHSKEYHEEI